MMATPRELGLGHWLWVTTAAKPVLPAGYVLPFALPAVACDHSDIVQAGHDRPR